MDKTTEEWDLLSIIYETAHDPGFWPLALEGLKVELTNYGTQPAETLLESTANQPHTINDGNKQNSPAYYRHTETDLSGHSANVEFDSTTLAEKKPDTFIAESHIDVSIDNMHIGEHEKELIVKLTPHFNAALELNRKFVDLTEAKAAANSLLDKIPFGIILVNKLGKIILENKAATNLLTSAKILQVANGYIKTINARYTQDLMKLIDEVSDNTLLNNIDSIKTLTFKANEKYPSMSILVTPYLLSGETFTDSQCVALYVATSDSSYRICEQTLSKLFNLTKAEARLTQKIASGESISSFAKNNNLSKHTIRSQLKTIYSKTRTHSQSELMKLVLTSPTIFGNINNKAEMYRQPYFVDNKKSTDNILSKTDCLYLSDSRKLHYGLYGDENGEPVILCHGSYGCYIERYPDDKLTHSLGIRLIVPDRPGYGESDVKLDRSGVDWSEDLLQLIEHLGISKVSLLGVGVGGYFAIAAAYKLSNYLNKVVLVNSVAPFESVKEFSGMVPHDKIFFGLARHAPSLFKRFAVLTLAGLKKNIDWYFKSLEIYGGQNDRQTISNDDLVKHLKDMVCLASHHGITGFIQDMIIITKEWDFPLSAIHTHVSIYHGEKQVAIPLSMGHRLKNTLPINKSYFMANEGNYLLLNQWERIMREFV